MREQAFEAANFDILVLTEYPLRELDPFISLKRGVLGSGSGDCHDYEVSE